MKRERMYLSLVTLLLYERDINKLSGNLLKKFEAQKIQSLHFVQYYNAFGAQSGSAE